MKNIVYKKGKVHPSPTTPLICDHLSFLPATILALTVFLSPEDKEVLAYLISSSPTTTTTTTSTAAVYGGSGSGRDHPISFNCNCFRCYMSYWVRWDTSPNRQLIHEIIDAFEEDSLNKKSKTKKKKIRRKKSNGSGHELKRTELEVSVSVSSLEESSSSSSGGGGGEEDTVKSPLIRRFLNYIGENYGGFLL